MISKQEIKEVTLKYCKDTLENNAVEKEFEDEIHEKKEKVRTKLAETDGRTDERTENLPILQNQKSEGEINIELLRGYRDYVRNIW